MANLITIGEVFDRTIAHYHKHFGELIGISAWILVAALPAAVSKVLEPFTAGTELTPLDWIVIILRDGGGILLTIVSVWALISIIIAVGEEASGTDKAIAEQGKRAKKLFFPYIWVTALIGLIALAIIAAPVTGLLLVLVDTARNTTTLLSSIGGFLLLIGSVFSLIFLIKYGIEYGFAPYSLILEGERGGKALKHSSSLVKGRWWSTFFRFVIPKIIYTVVVFVANFIVFSGLAILLLLTIGPGPLVEGIGNAIWFLVTVAVTVFLTPLVAVTDYHIYDSLRKTR